MVTILKILTVQLLYRNYLNVTRILYYIFQLIHIQANKQSCRIKQISKTSFYEIEHSIFKSFTLSDFSFKESL